jgi:hypothetical protein
MTIIFFIFLNTGEQLNRFDFLRHGVNTPVAGRKNKIPEAAKGFRDWNGWRRGCAA